MATKEQQAGDSAAAKPARNGSVPLEKQRGSPSGSLHALRQLFGLLNKREHRQLFALFPLLLVNSALEVIGVGLIPVFVAALMEPQLLGEIPLVGEFLQDWIIDRDPRSLLISGAITLAVVFLGKNLYAIALQYALLRYCKGRQVALGMRLFEAYQNAPLEFLFARNTAEFIRNVNADVNMVTNHVILSFLRIVTRIITVVLIVATLFIADWKITLLALSVLGVLILLYAGLLNRFSSKLGTAALEARKDLVRDLTQGIQSIKETRVMGLEPLHRERVGSAMKTTAHAQRWQMLMGNSATPLLELVAVFGLVTVICVLAMVTEGGLVAMVPLFSLFAIALVRLRGYMAEILSAWNALAFRAPSVNTIANDIDHLEQLREASELGERVAFSFQTELLVNHVTYRYPVSPEPAVKDVTLRIPKGATIGFAGATGSGKTTLIDLVLGILRPDTGSVTLDGVPVHEILSLRKHVGYVPQFIYLFDDTIRRNIAVGERDEEIDDEQVWDALERAQIAEVVRAAPSQLSAMIGENGVRLSGGQRQRLGIARAIYHDPEIVVMDEGTSALDEETEGALMETIHALHGVKTVLLIAHRKGTLERCDAVYSMENGTLKSSS
ncbi:ABC transporter ATP-binding protein/permease [Akkermansiaceae bacterium]|nr:ABC transporter ATP-binding protein/permease [Akkermansiaceae bacterium]